MNAEILNINTWQNRKDWGIFITINLSFLRALEMLDEFGRCIPQSFLFCHVFIFKISAFINCYITEQYNPIIATMTTMAARVISAFTR
jgi:hypothetical protein